MDYELRNSETSASIFSKMGSRATRPYALRKLGILDWAALLIPWSRFIEFDLVGSVYLPDVLLAAMLPILLARHGRLLSTRLPLIAVGLLALWLLAQVITDVLRESVFHDYSRGWAMIGVTLINFCSLYMLLAGRPRRLVLFTAGAALGQITGYLLAPNDYALSDPWKFGYGNGLTWLLVLLAVACADTRRLSRVFPAAILLSVALLNISMGFRSAGGIAFLASIYLVVRAVKSSNSAPVRMRFRRMATLGVIAIAAAWGGVQLYVQSVQLGWLGDDALRKYEIQTSGEYGLIIGGRTEILTAGRAIIDSPVLGHGSWAKNCQYSSFYIELRRRAGYYPGEESEDCLIPAHSHLIGAWVQAGVIGAVFWVWVLTLPFRTLTRLYGAAESLAPLVAFMAFLMIWDILFSPFGGDRRFMFPFYVVLMMSYLPAGRKRYIARQPGTRRGIVVRD